MIHPETFLTNHLFVTNIRYVYNSTKLIEMRHILINFIQNLYSLNSIINTFKILTMLTMKYTNTFLRDTEGQQTTNKDPDIVSHLNIEIPPTYWTKSKESN